MNPTQIVVNDKPKPIYIPRDFGKRIEKAKSDRMTPAPVRKSIPDAGGIVSRGERVDGPLGTTRFRLRLKAYLGYTYEVSGRSNKGDHAWECVPFALSQMGQIDRKKHVARSEGELEFYLSSQSGNDFFSVTFHAPGLR